MTTARTITTGALQRIGVIAAGEVMAAEDADLALNLLNGVIESWRLVPSMQWRQWLTFSLPGGTQSRTIGPTGQWVAQRPLRIEDGSFTRVDGLDRPLSAITAQQYASVDLKTTSTTWPTYAYLETGEPNGTVYFWPVAGGTTSVHLLVRVGVSPFASLNEDQTLPAGYARALELTLCEECAVPFGRDLPARIEKQAMTARSAIKRVNLIVPQLGEAPGRSRLGDFIGGGFDR